MLRTKLITANSGKADIIERPQLSVGLSVCSLWATLQSLGRVERGPSPRRLRVKQISNIRSWLDRP